MQRVKEGKQEWHILLWVFREVSIHAPIIGHLIGPTCLAHFNHMLIPHKVQFFPTPCLQSLTKHIHFSSLEYSASENEQVNM